MHQRHVCVMTRVATQCTVHMQNRDATTIAHARIVKSIQHTQVFT